MPEPVDLTALRDALVTDVHNAAIEQLGPTADRARAERAIDALMPMVTAAVERFVAQRDEVAAGRARITEPEAEVGCACICHTSADRRAVMHGGPGRCPCGDDPFATAEGRSEEAPLIDLGPLAHLTDPRAAGYRGDPYRREWMAIAWDEGRNAVYVETNANEIVLCSGANPYRLAAHPVHTSRPAVDGGGGAGEA